MGRQDHADINEHVYEYVDEHLDEHVDEHPNSDQHYDHDNLSPDRLRIRFHHSVWELRWRQCAMLGATSLRFQLPTFLSLRA